MEEPILTSGNRPPLKIKTDVRPKFVSKRLSLPASGTASPRAKTDSATARMANQPSKASAVRLFRSKTLPVNYSLAGSQALLYFR